MLSTKPEPIRITVEVTRAMIRRGKQKNCRECPVAIAVSKATRMPFVNAGPLGIYVGEDPYNLNHMAWTPPEVWDWMTNFDNGRPVEPFSFEIDLVTL
jgi:hypothetical protein